MINMAIEEEMAAMIFHNRNIAKETKYMVRRPSISEKEDHQSGNIDMLNIYIATERFVGVAEVLKSLET
jgi:hypothetical protein